MTKKNQSPNDNRKLQVIQGGKGKKLSEPLIEVPAALANKIPKEAREKLEETIELLNKAEKDREIKPFFSCIFTGEIHECEVPTQAAIDRFCKALKIIKELNLSSEPHLLFAIYDLLHLAPAERILKGPISASQGIDFDRVARSHAEQINLTTSKLVELFRQQVNMLSPPFSLDEDEGNGAW